MTDLAYTVTIDDEVWSEKQMRRIEYERTLHVLHELKALGVPLKIDGRELSHNDLNWLEPERSERLSLDTRAGLGEEILDVYKDIEADSERRWKQFNQGYDPADMHLGTTIIEASGVSFQETMAVIGNPTDPRAALSTNPEHYFVAGGVEEGQRLMETFGMFGGPTYAHGTAEEVPANSPFVRDESFPVALFGQTLLKSDDTPIHVGALHQVRPTADGFVFKSTFNCPGKAPQAVADGHKIHFALEIVNSMKVAHAKKQGA